MAEDNEELNKNKLIERRFRHWTTGVSLVLIFFLSLTLYFIWEDIYCIEKNSVTLITIAMIAL
jgi:hypothetical protein